MDKNNVTIALTYNVNSDQKEIGEIAVILKELGYRYIIDYSNKKWEILFESEFSIDSINKPTIKFEVIRYDREHKVIFKKTVFLVETNITPPQLKLYDTVVTRSLITILSCLNEELWSDVSNSVCKYCLSTVIPCTCLRDD